MAMLIVLPWSSVNGAVDKKFTIAIDPGHGGKDVGATDNGVMEKNINLKVALELENLLRKKMKDTKVVMTRNDDSYLTLQQRADKANKAKADLFISIHTNSVDKRNRNRKEIAGSSVYTLGLNKDENNLDVARRENSVIELENDYQERYSGFDPQRDESYIIFEMAQKKNLSQSIKLAEQIEKELTDSGREDRGVRQAGFWVLWATSMPAVLVELDFICNPKSARYMASDKGAKELAQAIYKAIETYRGNGKKSSADRKKQNAGPAAYTVAEVETISEPINDKETAVAKSRRRTTSPAPTRKANTPVAVTGSQARKRRSQTSKGISEQQNYERGDLVMASNERRGIVLEASMDEAPKIENAAPEKTKGKASKPKKEKKKKSVAMAEDRRGKKNYSHNAKINKLVTVYKIQILASADLLNENNSRFCGLSPITTYKENNLYKYYYGESTDRETMETMLEDVRKKIPDAFLVESRKSVQMK